MSRRLGIYVFFDKDGIVDEYILQCLRDYKKVLLELIIIVNGKINDDGLDTIKKIATEVIFRDNVGYEMKAYEYLFLNYLSKTRLDEYDEVVFLNNSFYGPLISFETMFESMEEKNVDYWGVGYHDWGYVKVMHSFFLVFRKKILSDNFLPLFFEKNRQYDIYSLEDTVVFFEYNLSASLEKAGYKAGTYLNYDQRWILDLPDIYICDNGFPFIKRKMFVKASKKRVKRLLLFLKRNYSELNKSIIMNVERQFGSDWFDKLSDSDTFNQYKTIVVPDSVKEFIEKADSIYIWGAGMLAQKVFVSYLKDCIKFKGFIVSDVSNNNPSLFGFSICSLTDIERTTNIIVAVASKYLDEIKDTITKSKYEHKVLFINWN